MLIETTGRGLQKALLTYLPIVPFANDFEEVKICGSGTVDRRRTKISIWKLRKLGLWFISELKSAGGLAGASWPPS